MKMPTTIQDIPSKRVLSIVYYMRQELSAEYPVPELEALIHYAFKEVMGYSRIDVMMRSEDELLPGVVDRFQEVTERLKNHEPIQYIFGHTTFYGLDLLVNSEVLIPRPETEELVNWVLSEQKNRNIMRALDIGTGSGCIALALKANLKEAEVLGVDVSHSVVEQAIVNAQHNRLDVNFELRNILNQPTDLGTFDLIVSNPPYVTREQMGGMMPNVLNYEPHLALFVEDNDPLKYYKAIGHFCQKALAPNGVLYLEVNEDLATDTAHLLETFNFTSTSIKKDLSGKFRMVKAMW